MTFVTTFLSKTTNMSSTSWLPLLLSYQRLLTCLQFHNFRYFFLIKDYRHVLNTMTSVITFLSKITNMPSIPWLPLLFCHQTLHTCLQYHEFRYNFVLKDYWHVLNTVLSVLLRYIDSDCPFSIFKLFFRYYFTIKDYWHVLNIMTSVTTLPLNISDMSSISWIPLLLYH